MVRETLWMVREISLNECVNVFMRKLHLLTFIISEILATLRKLHFLTFIISEILATLLKSFSSSRSHQTAFARVLGSWFHLQSFLSVFK